MPIELDTDKLARDLQEFQKREDEIKDSFPTEELGYDITTGAREDKIKRAMIYASQHLLRGPLYEEIAAYLKPFKRVEKGSVPALDELRALRGSVRSKRVGNWNTLEGIEGLKAIAEEEVASLVASGAGANSTDDKARLELCQHILTHWKI